MYRLKGAISNVFEASLVGGKAGNKRVGVAIRVDLVHFRGTNSPAGKSGRTHEEKNEYFTRRDLPQKRFGVELARTWIAAWKKT